jgi:hypothetical protein
MNRQEGSPEGERRQLGNRGSRVRGSAVVAIAAAVAVVVWLALGGGSGRTAAGSHNTTAGSHNTTPGSHNTMTLVSERELTRLAAKLGGPVYWLGPEKSGRYALTRTSRGWVYVSYLPSGAKAATIHSYPFVATFPLHNAYIATLAIALRPTSVKIPVPGGVGFYYRRYPTSVYLAFKGGERQIEVFDPDLPRLRALISSGRIRPVH